MTNSQTNSAATSQELNARFAVDGVRFEDSANGLVRLVIQTPQVQGEVYLHGAHVTHFQPAGHAPVLFLSEKSHFAPEKPIRGGVPICFPWFGPRQGDESAPMHGMARLVTWDVERVARNEDSVQIVLRYAPEQAPHPAWPTCALQFSLDFGASLQMRFAVQNTGAEAIRFTEALHTYFEVGDVQKIEIEGLEATRFLDKTDEFREKTQAETALQISGETDRIYLDTQTTCVISDPVLQRKILVSKENSNTTVVWNPWIEKAAAMPDFGDDEWQKMLCIETCNVNKCEVELKSGEIHAMTAKIEVEML